MRIMLETGFKFGKNNLALNEIGIRWEARGVIMEFDDVNRFGSCHYAIASRIVDCIVSHPQNLPLLSTEMELPNLLRKFGG